MSFPDAEMLIGTFKSLNINAAIFSIDGKKWAKSEGFEITSQEAKDLAAVFKKDEKASVPDVTIAGQKFPVQQRDGFVYAGEGPQGSFAVCKTHKAIVIGSWKDSPTLLTGVQKVGHAADYMMTENY